LQQVSQGYKAIEENPSSFGERGISPILGVGEEILAERRADAHDDDRMGVVFSVRDHEEVMTSIMMWIWDIRVMMIDVYVL
jgi:hypothetical protein